MMLFLASFAFAGNGNDYIRQLEPDGVFVDPFEKKVQKNVEKEDSSKFVVVDVDVIQPESNYSFIKPYNAPRNEISSLVGFLEVSFILVALLAKVLFWRWVIRG